MYIKAFIPSEKHIEDITKQLRFYYLKMIFAMLSINIIIIILGTIFKNSLFFISIIFLIVFPTICLIIYEKYKEQIYKMDISIYVLENNTYIRRNVEKYEYNLALLSPPHNITGITSNYYPYTPSLYYKKAAIQNNSFFTDCEQMFIKKNTKQMKNYTMFDVELIDRYNNLQKTSIKIYKIYDDYSDLIQILNMAIRK